MKKSINLTNHHAVIAFVLSTIILCISPSMLADEKADSGKAADNTFDNLVPVKDPKVTMAYIDPEADFSVFKRVAILEPFVAFRSNWQRDQNRGRSRNVSARDMERIKEDVATLYIELFDSVSGQIIGRAADRQSARRAGGMVTWSNSVTNTADARRMMGGWADNLVGFLDAHYK